MKPIHTQTPWMVEYYDILGGPGMIAHVGTVQQLAFRGEEGKANADFIVKAVNMHDDLVEELKAEHEEYIRRRADDDGYIDDHADCQTCKLIAKAAL